MPLNLERHDIYQGGFSDYDAVFAYAVSSLIRFCDV